MKNLLFILLFTVLAGASKLQAQTLELSSSGELLDSIAAIVNDGIVLSSELTIEIQRVVARLDAEGTQVPPMNQLAPQILERLVIHRIQLQRAERLGIQIPDETLNLALANVAERNGVSLSDLPSVLASEGIDYTNFRTEMRDQLTVEQLRQRDVISRINVTPREIDEYVTREEGRATNKQEFKLSHILISTSIGADSEQISAAEKQLADILERTGTANRSRSSRSPIQMVNMRSTAATWAGARAMSCRVCLPMSFRE